MPQLNPESFVTQLFWLLLTFGALYVLLTTRGLPKIAAILAMREQRVENDLQQAKELQKEAVGLRADLERVREESQQQIRRILDDMKTDMAKTTAIRQKMLSTEIAAQTTAAEQRIKAIREEAFASIQETVAAVVESCVAKLSGEQPQQHSVRDSVRVITNDYQKLAS